MPKSPRSPSSFEVSQQYGVLSRRTFMKLTGASASAGPALSWLNSCADSPEPGVLTTTGDELLLVQRPTDLLSLRLGFLDLRRQGDQLVVDGKSPRIVVEFPRQHVFEETVDLVKAQKNGTPAPPLRARLSGTSRVVFRVPDGVDEIPYSLSELLSALRNSSLVVARTALPPKLPSPPLLIGSFVTPGLVGDNTQLLKPDQKARGGLTVQGLVAAQRALAAARLVQAQEPLFVPVALPNLAPLKELSVTPEPPTEEQTAIELPFRLLLSPNRYGRFVHASDTVASEEGWVEVWHSRLATQLADDAAPTEGSHPLRTARALWVRGQTFDPKDAHLKVTASDDPFGVVNTSIEAIQRNDIVHQTSNYTLVNQKTQEPEAPEPVQVRRLMLSALGGYLDVHGEWNAKQQLSKPRVKVSSGGVNTIGWTHRATEGRDQFVQLVTEGFMFPWGHRAVYVQISERKIDENGNQTAFLFKRGFLSFKQPVRSYVSSADTDIAKALRQLPFTSVQFRELVTPNLDLPKGGASKPFLPTLNGDIYRFPINAIDQSGRIVKAAVAGVWVPGVADQAWPAQRRTAANLYTPEARETRLEGQRVAYASGFDDKTSFETKTMVFGYTTLSSSVASTSGLEQQPFLPLMERADLSVQALRAFGGNANDHSFEYYPDYLEQGFVGANAGEVFLQLTDSASVELDFEAAGTDRAGGLIAPSMSIRGLSRRSGPVAGTLSEAALNAFTPQTFFDGAFPKLFGSIDLKEILKTGALDAAPQLVTEAFDVVERLLNEGDRAIGLLGALSSSNASSQANALQAAIADVADALAELDAAALNGGSLSSLSTAVQNLRSALPGSGVGVNTREALDQHLSALGGILSDPSTLTEALQTAAAGGALPKDLTARFEFRPQLQNDVNKIFVPKGGLLLAGTVQGVTSGGKPAGMDVLCSLEDFRLNLIGDDDPAFSLHFEHMRFRTRAGEKPDVDVVLGDIAFGGPLKFIESIKDIIPLDGFSDPPAIDVTPSGLSAEFSVPLPNLALGIFSLENLSISAGFEVPFLGDSITVRFAFCSRENPFSLTVAMLGGGGFVGIELSPNGIELLEVALEFGASLSVDFGVASGGVSIKAGVYLAVDDAGVYLEGYLRIRGEVDVMGLVSASIEMYMSLSYESDTGKVTGRAEIIVEIDVLLFSGSVTVRCERKFAGSNGDPTFAEIMAPCPPPALPTDECGGQNTPWAEYVNAFT